MLVTDLNNLLINKKTGEVTKSQIVIIKCDKCGEVFNRRLDRHIKRDLGTPDLCRKCSNSRIMTKYNKSMKGLSVEERFGEEKGKLFREKMSSVTSGDKNPRFGFHEENFWSKRGGYPHLGKTLEEIHGKEKATMIKKRLSEASSGSNNPMYGKITPQGSGNGWSGWYKGWYFRSLKELSFMINFIEKQRLNWVTAEKKEYRIPYKDPINGHERTYVCDFLIDNILVEVKPYKLKGTIRNKAKAAAAIEWCNTKNLKYQIYTERDFKLLTKDEIATLYETKQIRWLPRYEEKFKLLQQNTEAHILNSSHQIPNLQDQQ
jgi:hypothetical protein